MQVTSAGEVLQHAKAPGFDRVPVFKTGSGLEVEGRRSPNASEGDIKVDRCRTMTVTNIGVRSDAEFTRLNDSDARKPKEVNRIHL